MLSRDLGVLLATVPLAKNHCFVGVLLAGWLGMALLLAAFLSVHCGLHELWHVECGDIEHQCAATLLAQGSVESAEPPNPQIAFEPALLSGQIYSAAQNVSRDELRLSPSRAPPLSPV